MNDISSNNNVKNSLEWLTDDVLDTKDANDCDTDTTVEDVTKQKPDDISKSTDNFPDIKGNINSLMENRTVYINKCIATKEKIINLELALHSAEEELIENERICIEIMSIAAKATAAALLIDLSSVDKENTQANK